jgi:callose synthase
MMEEYTLSEGYTQTRSLYAGHFVDNVVTPIFDIVCKSMKSNTDHPQTQNYDDFNEFFWSRNCLGYRYSSDFSFEPSETPEALGPNSHDQLPPITEGLIDAPKTFLEKRSWLRGVLALFRILEWHIVTFYLLAVVAFSRELVWGVAYTAEVASGAFWIFNVLHLTLGLLEAWSVYPGIHLSGTAVCGSVFTLLARFLILVYQTLYLMWTFGPQVGTYLGIEAESDFWWWQYIWISLL